MESLRVIQAVSLVAIFLLVIFIMYRRGLLPDLTDTIEPNLSDKFDSLYYEMALPVLDKIKSTTERARRVNKRASKLKGAKNDNK